MDDINARDQWQVDPQRDQGFFDGSAEPNPGGPLGLGWHLIFHDGRRHEGSVREPADPNNTNNVAEYRALIALLTDYRALGVGERLIVRGDSQLILNQVFGSWAVSAPHLARYWREATGLVEQLKADGVQVSWAHIPRDRNARADQLAGGKAPLDPADLMYAEQRITDLRPALAEDIRALCARGELSFKQAMRLRVGGRDSASALGWDALAARAGAACAAFVTAEFPEDRSAREAALRWCLRGLPAQLASRKVRVDLEVAASRR